MVKKVIINRKHPGPLTFKEGVWQRRKQAFIRAMFKDDGGTVRYYGHINLSTMIDGNPPGFTIGERRYNLRMEKEYMVPDATNRIIYLHYTINIPDPDIVHGPVEVVCRDSDGDLIMQSANVPKTMTVNVQQKNWMDPQTFYDCMKKQEAHNVLTGDRTPQLALMILANLLVSVGLVFLVIVGLMQ